jgi:hypothetical protein
MRDKVRNEQMALNCMMATAMDSSPAASLQMMHSRCRVPSGHFDF